MVVTFVDVALDSVVPLALLVTPTIVAEDHYRSVGRDWGPSLAGDQDVGAGILWMLGDLAGTPDLPARTRCRRGARSSRAAR